MQVTITLNDNPQLLKAFKEMAKALNEPIKIKKQKVVREKWLEEYYKSDEFLEAVKEAEELEKAYMRGEVKYLDAEEFVKESMKW